MPMDNLQRPAAPRALGTLAAVCLAVAIVGGINWGLVGIFDFDLVAFIFGPGSMLSSLVYALIGIVSIVAVFLLAAVLRRPALARTTT